VAVADAISLLHLASAEIRSALEASSEAATLLSTAARFKGDIKGVIRSDGTGEFQSARRLLFEGDLVKVSNKGRGRHKSYRFFLFSDLLIYASKSQFSFSDKFIAHAALPLMDERGNSVSVTADPPEFKTQRIANGFRLDTDVKPLWLYALNPVDATDWKRNLREALAELNKRWERQQSSRASTGGGGDVGVLAPPRGLPPPAIVTSAVAAITTTSITGNPEILLMTPSPTGNSVLPVAVGVPLVPPEPEIKNR